jgi:6-phosphogluconolactonase (cycloisomerase 2 family)
MAMKVRALLSLMVVLMTMWLASCGHYTCGTTFGSATCSSSGSGISQGNGGNGSGLIAFTYVADFSQNGQISPGMALAVFDESAATYTPISSFAPPILPPYPTQMAIVGKQFLYVSSKDGNVYGFSVDSTTGLLTSLPNSPYAVAGGDSIVTNPSGTLIFVGDAAGQQVSSFVVNADGSLTLTGAFATSGVSVRFMATDGKGSYLYATGGVGSTAIAQFAIASGGGLTAVASPLLSNVSAIAGEPSGKFLFGVSWQNGDNRVQGFSIGSTGALTSASSTNTTGTPRNLAVHPNGKWLYTFSEDPITVQQEAIEGFDLNSTGTLTAMNGSPFTALIASGGEIEQSGQFLFGLGITVVGNGSQSAIRPYSIDPGAGTLTPWPANSIQVSDFPGVNEAAFAVTDAP